MDVCDPNLTALRALLEVREEIRDICDLQLVAFPQDGIFSFPKGQELMRRAIELGCVSLEAFLIMSGHATWESRMCTMLSL